MEIVPSFVIKIREFLPGDRSHLQELFLNVRQATFSWMDTTAFDVLDFEEATENECILVATYNDKIVGFISVWMQDLFIHHLYVDLAYQDKGVGKALLTTFLREVTTKVQLKCLQKNEKAIAFYKRNNFIEKEKIVSENGDSILFEYRKK